MNEAIMAELPVNVTHVFWQGTSAYKVPGHGAQNGGKKRNVYVYV